MLTMVVIAVMAIIISINFAMGKARTNVESQKREGRWHGMVGSSGGARTTKYNACKIQQSDTYSM